MRRKIDDPSLFDDLYASAIRPDTHAQIEPMRKSTILCKKYPHCLARTCGLVAFSPSNVPIRCVTCGVTAS